MLFRSREIFNPVLTENRWYDTVIPIRISCAKEVGEGHLTRNEGVLLNILQTEQRKIKQTKKTPNIRTSAICTFLEDIKQAGRGVNKSKFEKHAIEFGTFVALGRRCSTGYIQNFAK